VILSTRFDKKKKYFTFALLYKGKVRGNPHNKRAYIKLKKNT